MPPLELTGERTLPDVPEENYWFRRHLAVYEWIAGARAAGCGSPTSPAARATAPTCSRGRAAEVVGVDANPEAHEHARLRYRRPNLRFERGLVEEFDEPCDAIVFLQTIEHIHEPGRAAGALRRGARRSPTSRRRTGSPSRRRAPRSPTTPGTCASTRSPSTASCWSRTSRGSRCSASSTPASCACTSWRCGSAGTASTAPLRLTKPFYDRFVPAISASDFELAPQTSDLDRRPRLPRRLPCLKAPVGDLAIVLHSHMPYVEGFGTYPFGEEWLFDAVAPLLPAGARRRRAT